MPTIEEAAEELQRVRNQAEELEEKFRDIDRIDTDSVVREPFLSRKVESRRPEEKVAGVDGGILKKRYSSADILAVRAVAAVFDFQETGVSVDYVPGKNVRPEFHVMEPGDAESLEENAELERLKMEVGVAEKVSDFNVLVDGSIVPSYSRDDEIIKRYDRLFEKAGSGKLAGVVEDSYGKKMSSVLGEKLGLDIGEIRDTRTVDAMLEVGERSFVRKYSKGPVEHPVLQKMDDEKVNRLHTFYLKLSERDLPLRIDYYGDVKDADRLASLIFYMRSSESYSVPSPIVEADKRAKIPENWVKRLEKRFSPFERRRDRRVF